MCRNVYLLIVSMQTDIVFGLSVSLSVCPSVCSSVPRSSSFGLRQHKRSHALKAIEECTGLVMAYYCFYAVDISIEEAVPRSQSVIRHRTKL